MARFNLEDYETVEERIKRFYEANEDGRITTENLTTDTDRATGTWIVKASVYLTAGDQANNLPKATGLAFEVDGGQGANQTAALENGETSAIGRALANSGLSGNKRASREEMAKVERGVTPKPVTDWLAKAEAAKDIDKIRLVYAQAKAQGAPKEVLARIKARGESLSAGSQNPGDGTRTSGGDK
jgi:hypothetical protein